MPSLKFIKRRITSVSNTKQVMKAMNMVAASKVQKLKAGLNTTQSFVGEVNRAIDTLRHCEAEALENHMFVKPHSTKNPKNIVYVIITGDRGLCGSYNANISEKTFRHMNGKNEKILVIGQKGIEYFRRRGKNILQTYTGMSEGMVYDKAELVSKRLISLYLSGEADEIYLASTHFNSVMSHTPHIRRILPIDIDDINNIDTAADAGNSKKNKNISMNYEPDINSFLDLTIPVFISAVIYGALAESALCEQAARMVGMDSAANNATELISKSVRLYNRKRQGVITQEISEIINGVNMMN